MLKFASKLPSIGLMQLSFQGQSLQFTEGKPRQIDAPDLKSYPTSANIGLLKWQQQRVDFSKADPD